MSDLILASISANSATSLFRCTSFLYIALSTYSSEESLSIRLMITFLMSLIFFYCSVHDARNYFIYFQLCSLYFCVSSNLLHSNCIFIFSMLSLLSASFAEEHKPLACKLSSCHGRQMSEDPAGSWPNFFFPGDNNFIFSAFKLYFGKHYDQRLFIV